MEAVAVGGWRVAVAEEFPTSAAKLRRNGAFEEAKRRQDGDEFGLFEP
jgi:hypothetical protein